jgi:hypothetical protein
MSSAGGKGLDNTTMHPAHIETAAQFAIGVANGASLTDQVIRGPRLDDTGAKGTIQQFTGAGALRPAYTAQQTLLRNETLPFYRAQAGTTVAAPAPAAPPPAPAPKPNPVPVP